MGLLFRDAREYVTFTVGQAGEGAILTEDNDPYRSLSRSGGEVSMGDYDHG